GKARAKYSSLGYERGYLPIVTATYETDGVRYTQIAFAAKPDGQTQGWDIAFISFEAANVSQAAAHAAITARVMLMDGAAVAFADGNVSNPAGAVLVSADENAKFKEGGE